MSDPRGRFVIRNCKSKDRQHNDKKKRQNEKQRSIKNYTEN
jgi:hypothetical protein